MKNNLISITILIIAGVLLPISTCKAQEIKPNIVFILADDCTKYDLACYGSKDAVTPNIDRLAKSGIKFNNCHQQAPMCSPTRHSLYTGMYPVKIGAYPNHTYVKKGVKTVVQYLKPLGYRVALSGKRHILPREIFDFEYLDGHPIKETNPDFEKVESFIADANNKKENFCLFVCSTEPHSPWNKGDTTLFKKDEITLPPHYADTPLTRTQFRNYLAEINYLDSQVKQTIDLLKKYNLYENTLLIFSSEQGNSFPFAKWTCYNAGLTSALIACWPGRITPGIESDALVEYVDILPTLIEVAGGKANSKLDGNSLTGLFDDPTREHKQYTYGLQTTRGIYHGAEYYPIRSVSDGEYRLILNLSSEMAFKNSVTTKAKYFKEWSNSDNPEHLKLAAKYITRPAMELYNDKTDIYNQHNLIDDPKYQPKLKELKEALHKWMDECGDKGLETELQALPNMRHSMDIGDINVEMEMHKELKEGNIEISKQGYYTFYLKGEGKLYVDGKLLVAGKKTKSKLGLHGVIGLKKGKHQIKVVEKEEVTGQKSTIFWSGPEMNKKQLK